MYDIYFELWLEKASRSSDEILAFVVNHGSKMDPNLVRAEVLYAERIETEICFG